MDSLAFNHMLQMQTQNSQANAAAAARYQAERARMLQGQNVQMRGEAPATATAPRAGTLYVHDDFVPAGIQGATNANANPHGLQVARTARRQGFQNQIVGSQDPLTARQTQAYAQRANLGNPSSSTQQIRSDIRGFAENMSAGLLDGRADRLDQLRQEGARNSAVNFSQGESRASTTSSLYNAASDSWSPDPRINPLQRIQARGVVTNYARAFNLDEAKLTNPDPRINGPERQRLQQNLAGIVADTYRDSPVLRNSQARYDRSVNSFEAGRNSVVVSAGNEFSYLDRMAADAGGRRIQVGENFTHNVLENEAVTSVGATQWFRNNEGGLREARAGYSSRGAGVDIYASGSLGIANHQVADAQGTSLAAPRVAATMAELHRRNPNMNSNQIEALMTSRLTHGLNDSRGQMDVLDHQRTADFLARGTF